MMERLFLDGVDTIAAGATIGGQHNAAILTGANETQALLAFMELAETGAQITLNPPILQQVPKATGNS